MEPANGDGPPFELNSYQEAEFHLSIYHYFLWKAAQEKSKGSARPHAENGGGPTADATPSPNVIVGLSDHDEKQNNDSALENNGNGQKYGALTDGESNDSPDADSTAQKPSARVDNGGSAASSSQNFQQVADAILQQFPQHVDFFTPTFGSMDAAAQLSLPPVVTTLYKEFPRLQTELAAAQTRMGQLESVLLTKHYETVTLNNEVARLKLQISFGPGLPPTPIAPQNNKRKDPPVVSVDGGRRPKVDAATLAAAGLKPPPGVVYATANAASSAIRVGTKKRFLTLLGQQALQRKQELGLVAIDPTDPNAPKPAKPLPAPPKPKVPKPPTPTFEERLQELDHYRKGNGHCRVPTNHPGLGRWVGDMRRVYKEKKLTQEQIDALEAMGFEWTVKEPPVPWEQRFEQLIKYKEEHGHCNVPRVWKVNPHLGEFVHMQRQRYRLKGKVLFAVPADGGKSRAQKLEEIGFEWRVGAIKPTFEERIEECREFRRENGHLRIPQPSKPSAGDEPPPEGEKARSFCMWAQRQRDEYRRFSEGMKAKINKTRIKKMDEMGFDWDFDRTEKGVNGGYKGIAKDNVLFKARIAQLAEVNEKFGDCNDINVMRAAGHPETSQLYQWLKRQRKAWKSLKAGQWSWLDAERIAMLESIKINWEPYKHRLPYGAKKAAAAAAASEQGGAAANPDGAVAGQGATNGHGANTHHPNAAGDMDDDSSDEDVDDDDEEEEEDNTFHHLHHHDRYRT